MKHNRIYIIGTGGSGKSYLADLLSDKYGIPHYHLDDIFWFKKYTKQRNEKYRLAKIKEISRKKKWIIEGAYTSWVSDAIKKADLVIWLYPHEFLMAWRVAKRHLERKFSKPRPKEGFKDLIKLLVLVLGYRFIKKKKLNKTSYEKHRWIIEKHKCNFILIRSKRELKAFLNDLGHK